MYVLSQTCVTYDTVLSQAGKILYDRLMNKINSYVLSLVEHHKIQIDSNRKEKSIIIITRTISYNMKKIIDSDSNDDDEHQGHGADEEIPFYSEPVQRQRK